MPAATLAFISKHYFNTMFQHEVFQINSTLNAGSLCLRHVNHGNTNTRLFFWTKGHKIVEILALLTTKLPCSKIGIYIYIYIYIHPSMSCLGVLLRCFVITFNYV